MEQIGSEKIKMFIKARQSIMETVFSWEISQPTRCNSKINQNLKMIIEKGACQRTFSKMHKIVN